MTTTPTTRKAPLITHSCGAAWSKPGAAHCCGCHRTFSCDSAFDAHRIAGLACMDPATATTTAGKPKFVLRHDTTGHPMWGWPGTWKPETEGGER